MHRPDAVGCGVTSGLCSEKLDNSSAILGPSDTTLLIVYCYVPSGMNVPYPTAATIDISIDTSTSQLERPTPTTNYYCTVCCCKYFRVTLPIPLATGTFFCYPSWKFSFLVCLSSSKLSRFVACFVTTGALRRVHQEAGGGREVQTDHLA